MAANLLVPVSAGVLIEHSWHRNAKMPPRSKMTRRANTAGRIPLFLY